MIKVKPVTVISMGDPSGISPEIIVKAFKESPEIFNICIPVISCVPAVINRYIKRYNIKIRTEVIERLKEFTDGKLYLLKSSDDKEYITGKPDKLSGKIALNCLTEAVKAVSCLKRKGEKVSLVTAPVSKEAIIMSGVDFKGHTEFLRDFTGVNNTAMLMISDVFKVLLLTRHVPISDLSNTLRSTDLFYQIVLAVESLKKYFRIKSPQVFVCNFNPHQGEGGKIGTEEQEIIIPLVRRLEKNNIKAEGPLPAYTIFKMDKDILLKSLIVSTYHDQAMLALKLLCGNDLVNLTCGLPFIRTSPAHGIAQDIAGKDIADPHSMIKAIKFASELTDSD